MNPLRTKLLAVAAKEVDYTEAPPNSNRTKYGKWFGLDGVAWCGMFVSWVYAQAGSPLPPMGFPKGFAGCQTAAAYFTRKGLWVKDPLPGDIVLFDWNMDGRFDHTGIYVSHKPTGLEKTGRFNTLEGNTSLTNQSNGGQVMRRVRDYQYARFARVIAP